MTFEELTMLGDTGFKDRLRRSRENAHLDQQEVARAIGISRDHYIDLELCDGELDNTLSLREFCTLCALLSVTPQYLLNYKATPQAWSSEQLLILAKQYISTHHINQSVLGDMVGFDLDPFFANASNILDWTFDFLRIVCELLGVDWHCAAVLNDS